MIIWSKSPAGANLPLDAAPVRGLLDPRVTARVVVYVLRGDSAVRADRDVDDEPLYISHFATCPNAGAHSKPRGGRTR